MRRKSSNAQKLKDTIYRDTKILKIYSHFRSKLPRYKKNNSFLVAISGGPDSMALAAMSFVLKNEEKFKVFFALVDHGIRKNSNKEASNVKLILKKKGINIKILRNKKKIFNNIQKNARDIRYDLLRKFCKLKKIQNLLTAHHEDDQIETFLIRLSRGSGLEGLSSMNYKIKLESSISLIRPLLDIKKSDLIYISRKIFGKILVDPSNKNKKFLRTNIRNLKKILEKKGIETSKIIRSIKNLKSTKDAIDFYVNKSIKKFVSSKGNSTILDMRYFKKEPQEVRFRIINSIVKKRTNSYYPPRSKKVLNLINRFENGKITKCTLGGCIFEKKRELLYVSREI
mgnify:CR=1 FL=1|tara:strand:+ start:11462 stop:12484 length:1023 start_codon:yes stop_codon:yes gene_type:complete